MKVIETYNGFKGVCAKCEEELQPDFSDQNNTVYKCNCGETTVNSDRYHNIIDINRKSKDEQQTKELTKQIMNYLNSGKSIDALIQSIGKEHRTLQQVFTNVCISWLKYCANLEHYDGRNEASVKLAKEIFEKIEDVQYKMPLI